ncbi:MAG: hypothetical protein ARM1_0232 [Candidatus Micrarchaeota archaeon]|nr:MAG: hypothetical protein ARM1_0232 [Candidatus Micrarchaeota archaeon]
MQQGRGLRVPAPQIPLRRASCQIVIPTAKAVCLSGYEAAALIDSSTSEPGQAGRSSPKLLLLCFQHTAVSIT